MQGVSFILSIKELNVYPIRATPDITVKVGSCPRCIVSSGNQQQEEGTPKNPANASFSSQIDILESSNQVDPFSEQYPEQKLGETISSCCFGCYLRTLKRIVGNTVYWDIFKSLYFCEFRVSVQIRENFTM